MILCWLQLYHPFALESLVRQQKTKGDNTSKDFVTQVTVCVGIDLPTIFTIFTTQFNKKWLITILLDIKVFYLIGFNSLLDIKVFYFKLTSRDKSPANNLLPWMIMMVCTDILYLCTILNGPNDRVFYMSSRLAVGYYFSYEVSTFCILENNNDELSCFERNGALVF